MALLRGFGGAHGTYDREELNETKRKQEIKKSARTLREPVTAELWEAHLAGERHLGIITITEENECWWGAVDIDDYSVSHTDIVALLRTHGVPALVCRTKSGGAHVYLFFRQPIPARDVMPKLRELSAVLGYGESEVYPKQTAVASDQQGLGNWLNMPYFGGDQTRCYAIRDDGRGLSMAQFMDEAEKLRMSSSAFLGLQLHKSVAGWEEAPPCLEHLAGIGVGQGIQNNAMFSFAVYARRVQPEGWETTLQEWNLRFFKPVHPHERMQSVIKSVGKKEYNYKCHDQPCVSHCNMALCRTRKYGIGPGGGADIIDSVSILDTEPPIFYVLLKTGGTVECDAATILNPRSFQQATAEQLRIVLPLYKLETWLPQVQRVVEGATTIDAPAEVGTTGQMVELLERFCTDRHAGEHKEEILLGKPWRDEDTGRVWFRLRDLTDFFERSKFRMLRRGQITERIKSMDGGSDFFNVKGKGTNVWYIPLDKFTWQSEPVDVPADGAPL